jgi:hypothetical protein
MLLERLNYRQRMADDCNEDGFGELRGDSLEVEGVG